MKPCFLHSVCASKVSSFAHLISQNTGARHALSGRAKSSYMLMDPVSHIHNQLSGKRLCAGRMFQLPHRALCAMVYQPSREGKSEAALGAVLEKTQILK